MISQTLLEYLLQLRLTAFRKGLQEQATTGGSLSAIFIRLNF